MSTFYTGPNGAGVGLDLGVARPIRRLQFTPRPGLAARLVGSQFQASNSRDFAVGVVTLHTVLATPPAARATAVPVDVPGLFRYVRLVDARGAPGDLADLACAAEAPTVLTGTFVCTPGARPADAFDGDHRTYFDAPAADGSWVGIDLGAPTTVSLVRFAPRAGWATRMVGGQVQASNARDFSAGVVTVHTVTTPPASGVLTTVALPNVGPYRYWRYLGPPGSHGNIAELAFET